MFVAVLSWYNGLGDKQPLFREVLPLIKALKVSGMTTADTGMQLRESIHELLDEVMHVDEFGTPEVRGWGADSTALAVGYLSFEPMARCVVHALQGLACRARVTPASSPASHCKQCSALTSPSPHACGCASPSRAR